MTQKQVIEAMNAWEMVDITPEFREFWNRDVGNRFYIQKVGISTARIVCNETHQIYDNASLKSLVKL